MRSHRVPRKPTTPDQSGAALMSTAGANSGSVDGDAGRGKLPKQVDGMEREESGMALLEGPPGAVRVLLVDKRFMPGSAPRRPFESDYDDGGANALGAGTASSPQGTTPAAAGGTEEEWRLRQGSIASEEGVASVKVDGSGLLSGKYNNGDNCLRANHRVPASGCGSHAPILLLGLASMAARLREGTAPSSPLSRDGDEASAPGEPRRSLKGAERQERDNRSATRDVAGPSRPNTDCHSYARDPAAFGDWFTEADIRRSIGGSAEVALNDTSSGPSSSYATQQECGRELEESSRNETGEAVSVANAPASSRWPGEPEPAIAAGNAPSGATQTADGPVEWEADIPLPFVQVASERSVERSDDAEGVGRDRRIVVAEEGEEQLSRGSTTKGSTASGTAAAEESRGVTGGTVERPFRMLEVFMMENLDGPLRATPNR